MKSKTMPDELRLALARWKAAQRLFDLAEPDEAAFTALEAEAAKRRYVCLLSRQKHRAAN